MRTSSLIFCAALAACQHSPPSPTATGSQAPLATPEPSAHSSAAATPTSIPPPPTEALRFDELAIPGDLPAFALRGNQSHQARYVFLAGLCSHPLGYVQSFTQAAADHGDLVTLQGDVSCGGPYRKWSYDVPSIAKRIDAALTAAGIEARDVTLIGYSQGAAIAERLAARYPGKFTRVILMASPIVPSADRLRLVDGAVLMAGTRDSQTNMREGARLLGQAKIHSIFQPIPGARHGEMGNTPDATMDGALEWLEENSKQRVTPELGLR